MEFENQNRVSKELSDKGLDEQLLSYFEGLTLPITLQYYSLFRKDFAVSFEELRNLVVAAFQKFLEARAKRTIYDIDRYFKYLYIQTLKNEIRRLRSQREVFNRKAMESAYFELSIDRVPGGDDSCNSTVYNDELVSLLIEDENSKLTPREKEVLFLYSRNYSLKEIAELLGLCYSVVFRYIKSTISKARDYINNNFEDL